MLPVLSAQSSLKRARSDSGSGDSEQEKSKSAKLEDAKCAGPVPGCALGTPSMPLSQAASAPRPSTSQTNAAKGPAGPVSRLSIYERIALDLKSDEEVAICNRLWKPNGEVLLWALSPTREKVLFKVHHALLVHYSKTFQRELVLGFPNRPPTLQIGVLCGIDTPTAFTVKLEDDSTDVEHFCVALYEKMLIGNVSPLRMDAALAVLKLSRKYDVKIVPKEIVARLLECRMEIAGVKTSSNGGDRTEGADLEGKAPTTGAQDPQAAPILWDPAYSIPLANAAQDLGLKKVLPLALYACYQLGALELADGTTLPDGTHEQLHYTLLAKLTAGDISFEDPLDGCIPSRHADTCWKDYRYPPGPEGTIPETHPLGVLEDWRDVCMKREMCGFCTRSVESRYKRRVQYFFAQAIPKAFGLL